MAWRLPVRMIFEQGEDDDFFEVILNEQDLEDLRSNKGVMMDYPYGFTGKKNLNLFVRTEFITNKE